MSSSVLEYLKLIPTAIDNREKIFTGIVTDVKSKLRLLPEDQQNEIIRRRAICRSCEYNSTEMKKKGYKTKRLDFHCTLCSCPIETKTASLMSECGAATWNLQNPDDKIELKWKTFNK